MKKVIAIICAVLMLVSFSVQAFASEWDFMEQNYFSYDGEMQFYVELNKPLEFMALLNEDAGFDVKYFTENLLKTKINAKIQAEITEDMKAAKIYMAFNPNVPVHISEDIKIDANVTGQMWVEYDFTSYENEKYILIVKNPLNGELLYVDFFDDALTDGGAYKDDLRQQIGATIDKTTVEGNEEINSIVKKAYSDNATLVRRGENATVKFTNSAFVDFVFDLITNSLNSEFMKKSLENNELTQEELSEVMGGVDIATIKALVKGLGIFAETDAFWANYKIDKKGYITEAEEKLHFDFNIYEVATALGAEETDIFPLTKENSDIDITLCTKTVYSKINEKNIVSVPTLTEENSKNLLLEMIGDIGYEDWEDDFYYEEDYYVEYEQSEKFWDYAAGKMDRGGMFVDIEEFVESSQWDDDELSGAVATGEDGGVVIEFVSNTEGKKTVVGSINHDNLFINGEPKKMRKPFIAVSNYNWETYSGDKKIYINVELLKELFGCEIQSMTVYLMDENGISLTEPEYYFEIVRPNKGYTIPVEKVKIEDAATIGVIGGADGPTAIFVTE